MFALVMLALGVIYSRVHWIIKAGLISASLVFTVLLFVAYVGSLGYATPVRPPPMFRFLYGFVHEPSRDNDPGAIYIWLLDHNQPRAIVIDYTSENRKQVAKAKQRIQEGEIVYMGLDDGEHAEGKNAQSSKGNKSSGGSSTVPYSLSGPEELIFKQPPDTLPKKE